MSLYYNNRYFLAFMCAGNEGFFVFLYLMRFYTGPLIAFPPVFIPILQLITGGNTPYIELVRFLAFFVCGPVMALKQVINVVQWISASAEIVDNIDSKQKAQ